MRHNSRKNEGMMIRDILNQKTIDNRRKARVPRRKQVEEDLGRLGIRGWRKIAEDCQKLKQIVRALGL